MARTPQQMTTLTGMDMNTLLSAPMDGVTASTFGFDSQSTKAVGLAKLRNRVCKLLFTKKGSNPLDLSEGTDFVDIFVYNIEDLNSVIVLTQNALTSILDQVQTVQNLEGPPDSERLTSLQLRNVYTEIVGISRVLHIVISISSAAGETAVFELPSAVG